MKKINNAFLYDAKEIGAINFEYLYVAAEDKTIYFPNTEEDANMIIDFLIGKGLTVKCQTIVRSLNDYIVIEFSNGDEVKFYKN